MTAKRRQTIPSARATAQRPSPRRRGGRPRNEVAQRAILAATLEILAEVGVSRLTVEGVAARAGVGKATIYRRWTSKLPLVVDAISTLPELTVPRTGALRSDLRQILGELARILQSSPLGRVLSHVAAERGSDAELDDTIARCLAVRRVPLVAVVRRGLERGELPSGLDPLALTDLLAGPIVNRLLFSHDSFNGSFIDLVIDTVLTGTARAAHRRRPAGAGNESARFRP